MENRVFEVDELSDLCGEVSGETKSNNNQYSTKQKLSDALIIGYWSACFFEGFYNTPLSIDIPTNLILMNGTYLILESEKRKPIKFLRDWLIGMPLIILGLYLRSHT